MYVYSSRKYPNATSETLFLLGDPGVNKTRTSLPSLELMFKRGGGDVIKDDTESGEY